MQIEINEEGYCNKCNAGHNCYNCKIMENLDFFNKELLKNIPKNEKKKKNTKTLKIIENKNSNPICGCGQIMKKSKFKNGPAYWCSCSKSIRY